MDIVFDHDCILASDIDGTITSHYDRIDQPVIDFFKSLINENWGLYFITGRFFSLANKLFTDCKFPYFIAPQNGAALINPQTGDILFKNYADSNALDVFSQITERYRIGLLIESGFDRGDKTFIYSKNCSHENKEFLDKVLRIFFKDSNTEGRVKDINLLSEYIYSDFAAAKIYADSQSMAGIKDIIEKFSLFSGIKLNITVINFPWDKRYFVMHITHENASKDQLLKSLISKHYTKKPFIVTAGDDCNDIGLIASGDFKIVMETAPKSMLNKVDCIASSAKKFGIINAIDQAKVVYECRKNSN